MAALPEPLLPVRQAREGLLESGPPVERTAGDFDRVSVPASDCDLLRDVLLAEKTQVVIEIGLAYGSSALAIAEALVTRPDAHTRHLIIDAFQDEFHDVGWNTLASAGLQEICTLLRERSQLALPRMAADGFVADAAFVDGSHLFHNVFTDLVFLNELVRPGGLVILDDCDWPSVATAVEYFEENRGWQREPLEPGTRLGRTAFQPAVSRRPPLPQRAGPASVQSRDRGERMLIVVVLSRICR